MLTHAMLTFAKQCVGKWAQQLTVQNGAVLYLGCGVVCVYLNSVGSMSAAQVCGCGCGCGCVGVWVCVWLSVGVCVALFRLRCGV